MNEEIKGVGGRRGTKREKEGKKNQEINKKQLYIDLKLECHASASSRLYKELEDIYIIKACSF